MAHRLEASTSYYAEAPPSSSPCETAVSGRAEAEQDVNRRVVPQMSTASGPVEAEIQRRVAFALAETQAVPYSPTPKTQPIVGVAPMTPMPVFLGLSQPGSSAQPPAPLLLKAPPDEPPMNGPAMGPVRLKAPPNLDSVTRFRNTINEAHLRRAATYLPKAPPNLDSVTRFRNTINEADLRRAPTYLPINVPAVKAPPPIRLVTGPDVRHHRRSTDPAGRRRVPDGTSDCLAARATFLRRDFCRSSVRMWRRRARSFSRQMWRVSHQGHWSHRCRRRP